MDLRIKRDTDFDQKGAPVNLLRGNSLASTFGNEYAVGWYARWDLPVARYRQPGQVDIKQDEIFQFLNKEIPVYIDADTVGNMDLGYLGRYLHRAWLHLHEGHPSFQSGGFLPKPFRIPKQTAESLDELSSFHRDLTHTFSVHLDDPVHFQQGRDHATIASQPVSPSNQSFKDHCYLIRPLLRAMYMVVDDQALAEYTKPLPVPEPENENSRSPGLDPYYFASQDRARFASFLSPINLLPLFDAGLALNGKRQDYQDQEKPVVVRVKLDDVIRFI
ncbi:hypothetical protein ACKRZS_010649 [Fusarium odoratissimum]